MLEKTGRGLDECIFDIFFSLTNNVMDEIQIFYLYQNLTSLFWLTIYLIMCNLSYILKKK